MQPIDQNFLTAAIYEATSSVFATMLESDVQIISPGTHDEELEGGVVSLIGMTGPWTGTGSITCKPCVAGLIASRMLMTEPPEDVTVVGDEIMDAVAELANMIIGNIKNIVEERVGPMAISIPTVIYGRNFQFKSLTGASGLRVPFTWDGGRVDVRVSLAPAPERHATIRHRMDQAVAA